MSAPGASLWTSGGKRAFDLLASAAALVILSPLMLITAGIVWRAIGRPILFKQNRIGRDERFITISKFRTMTNARGEDGQLLPSGSRLTPAGRRIRRYSLDELPQLISVLRGDLSLVGPRPLLPEYLDLYSVEHRRRHEVSPGLTGLAQVRGRNRLTWPEKFDLDLLYVRSISFALDMRILAETVRVALLGSGVEPSSGSVSERFRGYGDI